MKKRINSLLIIGGFLVALPFFLNNPYYLHLLIFTGMYGILAMGVALLLKVRLVSLGIAGFWAAGAYTSCLCATRLGLSPWFCLLIAGVVTAIVAFVLGIVFVRTGGLGFLMLTLVVNEVIVLVLGAVELFGGWNGIDRIPRFSITLPFFGSVHFVGKVYYYYLLLFLVGVTVLTFGALYKSRIGRAWGAIGSSHDLARATGINLFRYRLGAFVISNFFVGIAGSFYAHYQGYIQPLSFSVFKSILILIYAVLGGIGFFAGPFVGSFIGIFVPEFLRVTREVEPIFFGIIMLLIAVYLPQGVLGLRLPQGLTGRIKRFILPERDG